LSSPPSFHPISIRHTAIEPLGTPDESFSLASPQVTWLRKCGATATATYRKTSLFGRKLTLFAIPYFPLELNFANLTAAYGGTIAVPQIPLYKNFGYLRWGKYPACYIKITILQNYRLHDAVHTP
jgi:hypothetical protein